MDEATRRIYDELAATYEANRSPVWADRASFVLAHAPPDRPVLDAGVGTGTYLPTLMVHPGGVVGVDLSAGQLARVAEPVPLARADLARLPLGPGSLGGAWARNSYLHTPHEHLPAALRELHRALRVGAPLTLSMVTEAQSGAVWVSDDDLPGRRFSGWSPDHLLDVLVGAGFEIDAVDVPRPVFVDTRRRRSIADTVGPGMRLLVCGLNPSEHAADAGIGFVTPGNRFWPAAIEAGLVTRDRDPDAALADHAIGMTDLVKRATPRAAELTKAEYRDGLSRVERLCTWLRPGAVCFVGLAGWRAAVDRQATVGPQERTLGGRPVYVMPSTSGLNARTSVRDHVAHLRAALALVGTE